MNINFPLNFNLLNHNNVAFDYFQLNNRIKTQIQDKKRQISAMSANVSPEAQKLYLTITKT